MVCLWWNFIKMKEAQNAGTVCRWSFYPSSLRLCLFTLFASVLFLTSFFAALYRRNKQTRNSKANWSSCSTMQREFTNTHKGTWASACLKTWTGYLSILCCFFCFCFCRLVRHSCSRLYVVKHCYDDDDDGATISFLYFRCTVNLQKVLETLEDQELKENVEVMRNLQDIILELKVNT